ncbi:MAG: MFS transporter [Lactobacillaceae bacterium]|jgi:MFS family permease|nr:MFS transporter [Lactobacillaceae bacterium]
MNIFLKNKLFRRYASIDWISTFGDAFFYLALITYATHLANPGLGVLIVSISEIFPRVLVLITGALADESENRVLNYLRSGVARGIIYTVVGFVLLGQPSYIGLVIVAILNVVSDLTGSFVHAGLAAFIKFIVPEDDMEEAMGFDQSISTMTNLLGNFAGSAMLGLFSYSALAWVNAGSFFLVAILVRLIFKPLQEVEAKLEKSEKSENIKQLISGIWKTMIELLKMKMLRPLLILIVTINSLGMGIGSILAIVLARNPSQQFHSIAWTISIFEAVQVVFGISGNIIGPMFLKKVSNRAAGLLIIFGLGVFFGSLVFVKVWPSLIGLSLSTFFVGLISPRFSAMITKMIPTAKMGTVVAGMTTIQLLIPSLVSLVTLSALSAFGISVTSIGVLVFIATGIIYFSIDKSLDKVE